MGERTDAHRFHRRIFSIPINQTMRAMVLQQAGTPLKLCEWPVPSPGPGQILVQVHACGVCRTDLHIIDGELTKPRLPLIPGHEIVGTVASLGAGVSGFQIGERIGVPWLGHTCGVCDFCRRGEENLCDAPGFTGYTLDGGYAEYTVADQHYCFPLPDAYNDLEAAPLLCAGLIGYRSYRMAGMNVRHLGIYGFGAAAHIIAQIAVYQGKKIYAFTRPDDTASQQFARQLGAVWVGDSGENPPQPLDAAIIFAPVGALLPAALRAVRKGGIVVCGGIHMSDIPAFPYRILWEERQIRSVANLTRQDGIELLQIAAEARVQTSVTPFPLSEANRAISQLRNGQLQGAAVLEIC